MRVAVCSTQVPFTTGGAEALAESLHHELQKRGFESALITVPFAWVPRLEIVESALAWRLLSLDGPAGEPDLVIATKFPSYLVRHSNKVVWLVHQFRQVYDLLGTSWSDFGRGPRDRRLVELVRAMDDRAFGESRALYAISANVAERARRNNGVQPTVLHPPPRLFDRLETGPPGDYVLAAGRLDELKRVELLIESLSLTTTPVRCKIAGEGPLRDRLIELVRRHGLERRVELVGRVTDERADRALPRLPGGLLRAVRRGLRLRHHRGVQGRQAGPHRGGLRRRPRAGAPRRERAGPSVRQRGGVRGEPRPALAGSASAPPSSAGAATTRSPT